jgi:hypothetical protein
MSDKNIGRANNDEIKNIVINRIYIERKISQNIILLGIK